METERPPNASGKSWRRNCKQNLFGMLSLPKIKTKLPAKTDNSRLIRAGCLPVCIFSLEIFCMDAYFLWRFSAWMHIFSEDFLREYIFSIEISFFI